MSEKRSSKRSSARPLVAVTSDIKHVDSYDWHATPDQYLRAARIASDVMPVIVPALQDLADIDSVLDGVDGVLVTGSRANVHPDHYGHEATEAHEPYDRARDATTLPLIRAAIRRGVPLLAICRGIQELNVALGGTLATEIQTFEGRLDHRMPPKELPEERFALAHAIHLEPGAELGNILGAQSVQVNSLHRQAIDRLADDLIIEAKAPDGTIEAVRVGNASAFAMGVQWHPEFWAHRGDGPSEAIFRAFGDAVRRHNATRG